MRMGQRAGLRGKIVGCASAFLVTAGLIAAGCGQPKFPNCDNDDHCNADGHHGFCINKTCVQCRDDSTCGAGRSCRAGECAAIAGYCDDTVECTAGLECGKDHQCHQAPRAALPPKPPAVECDDTKPCGTGQSCQNGHCVQPPPGGPGCESFDAPRFDFESPELAAQSRPTLERLAKCLLTGSLKGRSVLLTGHCDPRGEAEFNLGLGAQRAETVKLFLVGLGLPNDKIATSSRGELDAKGSDDTGWSEDRRVDVEVR